MSSPAFHKGQYLRLKEKVLECEPHRLYQVMEVFANIITNDITYYEYRVRNITTGVIDSFWVESRFAPVSYLEELALADNSS